MSMIGGMVKNEWIKMISKKRIKFLLILTGLIATLIVIGQYGLNNIANIEIISSNNVSLYTLDIMTRGIIPFLAFIFSVDILASEKENKTINLLLTSGGSKSKIFISKLLAATLFNVSLLGIVFVIGVIGSFFNISAGLFTGIIGAFVGGGITVFTLMLVSMFGLLLGSVFSNGTMAIGMGLLGLVIVNVLEIAISGIYIINPVTYIDLFRTIA